MSTINIFWLEYTPHFSFEHKLFKFTSWITSQLRWKWYKYNFQCNMTTFIAFLGILMPYYFWKMLKTIPTWSWNNLKYQEGKKTLKLSRWGPPNLSIYRNVCNTTYQKYQLYQEVLLVRKRNAWWSNGNRNGWWTAKTVAE